MRGRQQPAALSETKHGRRAGDWEILRFELPAEGAATQADYGTKLAFQTRRPWFAAYHVDVQMLEVMTAVSCHASPTIEEIMANFAVLDEWDDRYRYIIELGRGLRPLPDRDRIDANKVQGCASQVWLATSIQTGDDRGPVLSFCGDSDAILVRGLIAILFATYSARPGSEILSIDTAAIFERLGLREHLSAQRSNGFRSMVERIRADARSLWTAAPYQLASKS